MLNRLLILSDLILAACDGVLDGLVTCAGLAGAPSRAGSLLASVNYFGSIELLEALRPALVYLAYPNNATANLWDVAVIDLIIEAAPGLVVMDEAYQPFAARDSMARLRRFPHVLLMRTMSKFGLAGVRIGYLMGRRELVGEIDKLRPPFNVSVLNAEAGLFALDGEQSEGELRAAIAKAKAGPTKP